jgi:hypothetical protein
VSVKDREHPTVTPKEKAALIRGAARLLHQGMKPGHRHESAAHYKRRAKHPQKERDHGHE